MQYTRLRSNFQRVSPRSSLKRSNGLSYQSHDSRFSNQMVSSSTSRLPDRVMTTHIGFNKIVVPKFVTNLEAFHCSKILCLRKRSDFVSYIFCKVFDVWSAVQIVTISVCQNDRVYDARVWRTVFRVLQIISETCRNVNNVCYEMFFLTIKLKLNHWYLPTRNSGCDG